MPHRLGRSLCHHFTLRPDSPICDRVSTSIALHALERVVRVILLLAITLSIRAQNPAPIDMAKMNLEDLMNIKVTSVSKREQKLSRTARLSKRIGESVEVSVVGQNLLRPRSVEYGDSNAIIGTQTVRSVYGKITWRF